MISSSAGSRPRKRDCSNPPLSSSLGIEKIGNVFVCRHPRSAAPQVSFRQQGFLNSHLGAFRGEFPGAILHPRVCKVDKREAAASAAIAKVVGHKARCGRRANRSIVNRSFFEKPTSRLPFGSSPRRALPHRDNKSKVGRTSRERLQGYRVTEENTLINKI